MSNGRRGIVLAAGVLGAALAAAPAFAQHSSGGHGGGGGHFGGGGGHSAAAAPAGHAGGGHYGGAVSRLAPRGPYGAAGPRFGGGIPRGYAGPSPGYYGGRAAYGYPGTSFRGYSTGAYWGGGYWRGGYWPRAYYGFGFSWFLPILPLAYATYWYGGIPYYYTNDVYYTWNPDYSGYTVTDPPPVAAQGSAEGGTPGGLPSGGASQVFMYPRNGQSEDQQATDRRECEQWAGEQAGTGAANQEEGRRAMLACVEGRGYSGN